MDFLLLIMSHRGQAPDEMVPMIDMMRYTSELASMNHVRGGSPLQPEERGARLRRSGQKTLVLDGPFAESKEVVGGYMRIAAKDEAEARDIARRCPAIRSGLVELRAAFPDRVEPAPEGLRFMLIFLETQLITDPDGSKYREMTAWTDALKRAQAYVECAGLPRAPAVRIESRRGKVLVTDGPFAESKEVIGGYAVVVASDLAAALEMAKRCPHMAWGEIEVREVMPVPPPQPL
jgi:hypothetical protein